MRRLVASHGRESTSSNRVAPGTRSNHQLLQLQVVDACRDLSHVLGHQLLGAAGLVDEHGVVGDEHADVVEVGRRLLIEAEAELLAGDAASRLDVHLLDQAEDPELMVKQMIRKLTNPHC